MTKVLITGANGHLGQRLIEALAGSVDVRAAVRSARAAEQLSRFDGIEVVEVSYTDAASMTQAVTGVDAVVHLVGILKEGGGNTYEQAHEQSCATLVAALHDLRDTVRVAYVSIVGSSVDSGNACLRSKGAAEEVLLRAIPNTTVLQVPMVLGENDYASRSLSGKARSALSFGFRMASLEQPIYAGDVVEALRASLTERFGRLQLAGPEALSRRALVQRAAAVLGRETRVVSLPMGIGMALAGLLERVSTNPPVTRAILGVLDHDDEVDADPAARSLGLELTALDVMLERVLS